MRIVRIAMGMGLLFTVLGCSLFSNTGSIDVTSNPSGADVYLDGQSTGQQTDCTIEEVEPGTHTVQVSLPEHLTWAEEVEVKKGRTAKVEATLEEIPVGTLRWQVQADGQIRTSPSIASDGTIYFGSWDEHLYAISSGGSERWTYPADGPIESSPVINSNGNVHFGSNDFTLYTVDENGNQVHGRSLADDISVTPAMGSDGTLYFGGAERRSVSELLVYYFYAYDPEADSILWKQETGYQVANSASIGPDGTVYFFIEDSCFCALNPSDGSEKFSVQISGDVLGAAAIDKEGNVYFGSSVNNANGYLYVYSASGQLVWSYEAGSPIFASPAIGPDGNVFFGTNDGVLHALSSGGSELWEYETDRAFQSTPAIGADGVIYIGAIFGDLYAVNPDGTPKWMYATQGSIRSSAAIGLDGTVYFGDDHGVFYAIYSDSPGLAGSAWPCFQHDNSNSGRAQ